MNWLSLMYDGLAESKCLGSDWMRTFCPIDKAYAIMFGCRNLQVGLLIERLDTNT